MDRKNLNKMICVTMLVVAFQLPAFSAKKTQELIEMPKTYPAKYSAQYVKQITPMYKDVGKDEIIYVALDMLRGTNGEFSRNAILGKNLSGKPVKIEFRDLGAINSEYAEFDALGWKKKNQLYIYINPRHKDAPPGALAALLSHEALHQDEYNSLAEETYAWTMEASVWYEIVKLYPESNDQLHPLVNRENQLKQLFERGNYSNKYIKKSVMSNKGYANLPSTSPGFEDL
ncbi:MAG: hypothetical protein BHW55_00670 [Candidatus Melainabacteria bacterium 35_41]|nr:MAG: hypothetical protein BHW55_00670 [Candidatus Melainabacteria bacterium 35_41]CDE89899.1 unknown [Clostridium sp. CAG:729]